MAGVMSGHYVLFLAMGWDMRKGAGWADDRLDYRADCDESAGGETGSAWWRRRRRIAPSWAAWPKAELFVLVLLLPLAFSAAAGLVATRSPVNIVAGALLFCLGLPIVTFTSGVVLFFQLVAYPEERHLYFEIEDSADAASLRWPLPVLSWFGIGLRRPRGRWRAESDVGRFYLRKLSTLFDHSHPPLVMRDRGGVLVPLASPAAVLGRRTPATDARWVRNQYGPIFVVLLRQLLCVSIMAALATANYALDPTHARRTSLAVTAMSCVMTVSLLGFSPNAKPRDQLVESIQTVAELGAFVLVTALYLSVADRETETAAAATGDDEAVDRLQAGQESNRLLNQLLLFALGAVLFIAMVAQVYNMASVVLDAIEVTRDAAAEGRRRAATPVPGKGQWDHDALARKFGNRWMLIALSRSLGPPKGDGGTVADASVPDEEATRRAFLRRFSLSVAASEDAGEGRLLRWFRRLSGGFFDWGRVGFRLGVTRAERRAIVDPPNDVHVDEGTVPCANDDDEAAERTAGNDDDAADVEVPSSSSSDDEVQRSKFITAVDIETDGGASLAVRPGWRSGGTITAVMAAGRMKAAVATANSRSRELARKHREQTAQRRSKAPVSVASRRLVDAEEGRPPSSSAQPQSRSRRTTPLGRLFGGPPSRVHAAAATLEDEDTEFSSDHAAVAVAKAPRASTSGGSNMPLASFSRPASSVAGSRRGGRRRGRGLGDEPGVTDVG